MRSLMLERSPNEILELGGQLITLLFVSSFQYRMYIERGH